MDVINLLKYFIFPLSGIPVEKYAETIMEIINTQDILTPKDYDVHTYQWSRQLKPFLNTEALHLLSKFQGLHLQSFRRKIDLKTAI